VIAAAILAALLTAFYALSRDKELAASSKALSAFRRHDGGG